MSPRSATIGCQEFRHFAGHFPTGVAVVTTRDGLGNPVGAALNAVTSLSLDPPLYLVCLANESRTLVAILRSGSFCINFLSQQQAELSRFFASKRPDKFADVAHRSGAAGTPVLADALAHCECRLSATHPGGDHTIVVGAVESLLVAGGDPLIYYRGAYAALGAESGAALHAGVS